MKETTTPTETAALEPSATHAAGIQEEQIPLKIRAKRQLQCLTNKLDQGRRQSEQAVRKNPWPALSTTFVVGLAAGTLAALSMRSSRA